MNDIIIYGAGGFGKEIASLIDRINANTPKWNLLGFIDDGLTIEESIRNLPILGGKEFLNNYSSEIAVVIAVGNVNILKNIVNSITNPLVYFPNLIDPGALVDPTIKLGKGNIITYLNFLSCDVILGDFNIFNTKCAIGHDTHIGSFNVFNPNVQISGSVEIGNNTFWGLNSSVVQGKKIADDSIIGACSLVLRSIKDKGQFYFGIPATKQKFDK